MVMVAVDMVGGRPVSQPIVIGLCGSYRSGCSTVADFLVDRHGYQLVTLSDEVRRLAAEEYGLDPTSRECLQDAGNRVRAPRRDTKRGRGGCASKGLRRLLPSGCRC